MIQQANLLPENKTNLPIVSFCGDHVLLAVAAAAVVVATGFMFGRFIVVGSVLLVGGTSTADADAEVCSVSPLHFNACSLDFCQRHIYTAVTDLSAVSE